MTSLAASGLFSAWGHHARTVSKITTAQPRRPASRPTRRTSSDPPWPRAPPAPLHQPGPDPEPPRRPLEALPLLGAPEHLQRPDAAAEAGHPDRPPDPESVERPPVLHRPQQPPRPPALAQPRRRA